MSILNTILPVFLVIVLGWLFHRRGFLPQAFLDPGNRLVFYLALPAMIFHAVAKASLTAHFDIRVVSITLAAVLMVFGLSWAVTTWVHVERLGQRGTIVQSAFHGNIGYIALAITYYALGNDGLIRASILAGLVMMLQNFLALLILHHYSDRESRNRAGLGTIIFRILSNPIIAASLAGFLVSIFRIPIPEIADHLLEIIEGLALPMALLIIGASLTFDLMMSRMLPVLGISIMKLLILPGLGYWGYRYLGLSPGDYLPGLIILATPTATIVVVMAHEIGGDMDFAVASVSLSTLLSALTVSFWLKLSGIL